MKDTDVSLSKEELGILESVIAAFKLEAEAICSGQSRVLINSELHYIAHKLLEETFDRLNLDREFKLKLREELGPAIHLMIERDKI